MQNGENIDFNFEQSFEKKLPITKLVQKSLTKEGQEQYDLTLSESKKQREDIEIQDIKTLSYKDFIESFNSNPESLETDENFPKKIEKIPVMVDAIDPNGEWLILEMQPDIIHDQRGVLKFAVLRFEVAKDSKYFDFLKNSTPHIPFEIDITLFNAPKIEIKALAKYLFSQESINISGIQSKIIKNPDASTIDSIEVNSNIWISGEVLNIENGEIEIRNYEQEALQKHFHKLSGGKTGDPEKIYTKKKQIYSMDIKTENGIIRVFTYGKGFLADQDFSAKTNDGGTTSLKVGQKIQIPGKIDIALTEFDPKDPDKVSTTQIVYCRNPEHLSIEPEKEKLRIIINKN